MAQYFDVLDCEEEHPLRWVMSYRDGRVRRSAYRHDLIEDLAITQMTDRALDAWPEARFFERNRSNPQSQV